MHIDKKALGNESREIRESLYLTQREVANMIGRTQGDISRFETGKLSSLDIMLWYVTMGLDIKPYIREGK